MSAVPPPEERPLSVPTADAGGIQFPHVLATFGGVSALAWGHADVCGSISGVDFTSRCPAGHLLMELFAVFLTCILRVLYIFWVSPLSHAWSARGLPQAWSCSPSANRLCAQQEL